MLYMYQPHPAMMSKRIGSDKNGNAVHQLYRWGAEVEPDPDREGYCRLKHRKKGSPLRAGNSYVALGLPDDIFPITIAAGAVLEQQSYTPAIQEDGFLGYHYIQGIPTTPTAFTTDIKHRGDSLLSGNVPMDIFRNDTVYTPVFGHFISENTSLTESFRNTGLAPLTIAPGFSLL